MKKIIRNRSDEAGRAFWNSAHKSAEGVKTWPQWKKGGITVEQPGVERSVTALESKAAASPVLIMNSKREKGDWDSAPGNVLRMLSENELSNIQEMLDKLSTAVYEGRCKNPEANIEYVQEVYRLACRFTQEIQMLRDTLGQIASDNDSENCVGCGEAKDGYGKNHSYCLSELARGVLPQRSSDDC